MPKLTSFRGGKSQKYRWCLHHRNCFLIWLSSVRCFCIGSLNFPSPTLRIFFSQDLFDTNLIFITVSLYYQNTYRDSYFHNHNSKRLLSFCFAYHQTNKSPILSFFFLNFLSGICLLRIPRCMWLVVFLRIVCRMIYK